ncbi:hypothetical protein, partial [Pseudomonas avellanae]|uniref:hypothetical protein n=1 Tax=Pseudomonas avellanae TaxID=46257 RepID=UPI000515A427
DSTDSTKSAETGFSPVRYPTLEDGPVGRRFSESVSDSGVRNGKQTPAQLRIALALDEERQQIKALANRLLHS